MTLPPRKVDSFDGQTVVVDGDPCYELGGFLGGGAAGVVYEGFDVSSPTLAMPVAVKILNPVGFRLVPTGTLRRCVVARRGQSVSFESTSQNNSARGDLRYEGTPRVSEGRCAPRSKLKLGPEHVWWLVHPNTKQVVAAYLNPYYGNLVELPLPECVQIWGYNPCLSDSSWSDSPNSASVDRSFSEGRAAMGRGRGAGGHGAALDGNEEDGQGIGVSQSGGACTTEIQVDGMGVSIPWIPPKYAQWLLERRKVMREIRNMSKIGGHRNVVKLLSVLELVQDSKSTLFLILELVTGGELLDHIRPLGDDVQDIKYRRLDSNLEPCHQSALKDEGAAQRYFAQLLDGLAYCHRQGICHRDLSPSNLLLSESSHGNALPQLKIADFGLSACCVALPHGNDDSLPGREHGYRQHQCSKVPMRMRSVVGSPHYVAPEVNNRNTKGYDGFKADTWSCGVILYTMLTASLPFDRDLARCSRFKRFKKWAESNGVGKTPTFAAVSGSGDETAIPGAPPGTPPSPPQWLFPPGIPPGARNLLMAMLLPDPNRRISVEAALLHPWLGAFGLENQMSADVPTPASSPTRRNPSRSAAVTSLAAPRPSTRAGAGAISLSWRNRRDEGTTESNHISSDESSAGAGSVSNRLRKSREQRIGRGKDTAVSREAKRAAMGWCKIWSRDHQRYRSPNNDNVDCSSLTFPSVMSFP